MEYAGNQLPCPNCSHYANIEARQKFALLGTTRRPELAKLVRTMRKRAKSQTVNTGVRAKWYVQEWLDYLGLTQAYLAKEVEKSPSEISEWISGARGRRWNADVIGSFARAMKLDPKMLMTAPPSKPKHELLMKIEGMSESESAWALKVLTTLEGGPEKN